MYPLEQKLAMCHADRMQTSPLRHGGRSLRRMFQSKTVALPITCRCPECEPWLARTVEFTILTAQVFACSRWATVFDLKHATDRHGAQVMFAYDRRGT